MLSDNYSPMDRFIIGVDQAVRILFGHPQESGRSNPATNIGNTDLSPMDRDLVGRLLRVNHSSEICTQAIYQGQALTANSEEVRTGLEQAIAEENDHLAWCQSRLQDFEYSTSILNPVLYAGSFALGTLSGIAGEQWTLALIAATERHVENQIIDHLGKIPEQDQKTRAILKQIQQDETSHADRALAAGAAELPEPVKAAVNLASKVVNNITYWI
ncbi:2-octaprenyl-3-methyl-6-methoxy-1,4-benzoquinol hydroxylase [Achromatium sp. WMS2]|nr:2-octaprenyl-3-methyl-6-methoxy-1,4-benzoquinol hydroxylase [Achromatium sp. WMS2]